MKQAVVPILSHEDAKLIPETIAHLKAVRAQIVLVVINPSAALDVAEFAKDVDKSIADMEQAKKEASSREDFAAAQQFKDQIEDAKMNRATSIAQGIRKVPKAKLTEAVEAMAAQFDGAATNVHHFTPAVDMDDFHQKLPRLHEKFTFLTAGGYSLIAPQSCDMQNFCLPDFVGVHAQAVSTTLTEPQKAVSPAPKVQTAPPTPKAPVAAPTDPKEAYRLELKRYMKLKSEAKKFGVQLEGRKSAEVAEEVFSLKFPVAA